MCVPNEEPSVELPNEEPSDREHFEKELEVQKEENKSLQVQR